MTVNARSQLSHRSVIASTGYAYPAERVDNDTFFARCRFDITDDREALVRETRMEQRTWCSDDENTWTMARQAVHRALEGDPALRDEIDVVIVASGTTMPVLHAPEPDNPGVADLAPLVLRELGLDGALGLDIKACYCTGFLRGLQVADGLLANPGYRSALVVATEQGSRFAIAETNRSKFCFIMSDAAGAVVLQRQEPGERRGLIDHVGYTDASKFEWVGIGADAASTIMRGSRAGEATISMLLECGRALLDRNGLQVKEVDWLLPIQTHAGIVEALRAGLEVPPERLLWNGGGTGFSGSASIPAALGEQVERRVVKRGDLMLSLAVGAGMNCAGALFVL